MIKPIDMPFDFNPDSTDPAEFEIDTDFAVSEFDDSLEDFEDEDESSLRNSCEEFFAPGGVLQQAAQEGNYPYEFRPQQLEMSLAIADALINCDNLCIEAPTGVGKSFAYLIPMIYWAVHTGQAAVISTETINLQEQLVNKDLPLLKKLTGIKFEAALAKGRSNYLCRRRFSMLSGEYRDSLLPSPGMAVDLARLEKWQKKSTSGERDSIDFRFDPAIWSLVCSEGVNCLGPKCEFFRNCFYYKARQAWQEADVVIANHALFFTDLAMRLTPEGTGTAGTLLPNYGAVLIDEAHTLEDNASEHLGLRLSRLGIVSTLNRLYNPDTARGLLMYKGTTPELRGRVAEVRQHANMFFKQFEAFLSDHRESALEIQQPGTFPDNLSPNLLALAKSLTDQLDDVTDGTLHSEIEAQLARCREFINGIDCFTHQTMPEAVYYAESERNSVSLYATPLNIAEILSEVLFSQNFPVILCSATLTVRNNFDYFIRRTGFCNGPTLQLDSPFDSNQAQIYISRDMPDPRAADFNAALVREIPRFVEITQGKAFVLFTSYDSMRFCADSLREYFQGKGWQLLIQGEGMTRSGLLREFKEDTSSVLFGTDSFWTGVDVPGEALSNVIVTKLPFAVPSHPLIAARMVRIEQQGGNSFVEYSLPEAVLKFRQGAGRLIRSRQDRGIIVLLDKRVITKNYGRIFLESLPYKYQIV